MPNEREAIVATADRIAQRMGGRFVLSEETAMTDKPEVHADIDWPTLLTKAVGDIGALLILMGDEDKISAWTADYCAAINRADAIATPAKPDASALVEALRLASGRLKWVSTANPGAGCDDGRALAASWADDAAAALSAWEQANG